MFDEEGDNCIRPSFFDEDSQKNFRQGKQRATCSRICKQTKRPVFTTIRQPRRTMSLIPKTRRRTNVRRVSTFQGEPILALGDNCGYQQL
ncbi:hypothetical protein OESDEN_03865 [Oesophagostomum dentatum]|uniref:Uncharacterized protein n=1 Tax=Oesophagostomum dentatum TaxID=61180 RepID=A0A0B1TK60_OESDE|nr:hypothetical protein OESDEN_03865 [Oesophagostomum dentatum]